MHPFVCLACGKGFKYEHSLNFHIKSYHGLSSSSSTGSPCNPPASAINSHVVVKSKARTSSSSSTHPSINNHENNARFLVHSTSHQHHRHQDSTEDMDDNGNDLSDDQSSCDVTDMKIPTGMSSASDQRSRSPGTTTSHSPPTSGEAGNLSTKGITIRSEKPLVTLLEGHHAQSDQTYTLYKCSLCGFAFPCLEPMLAHIQSTHSNQQSSSTCDKCGATFKWRSELQLHEQLHKAMDGQSSPGTTHPILFPQSSSSSPPPASLSKQTPQHLILPSFLPPNLLLFNPFFDKLAPDSGVKNGTSSSAHSISSSNNNGTSANNNSSLILNKNAVNGNNNSTSHGKNGTIGSNGRKTSSSSSNGSASHVNGHHADTFSEQVLNLSKGGSSSSSMGERNPKSESKRKSITFDHQQRIRKSSS